MAVYSKDFAKSEDEEHCKWYDEPFLRPYPYCHFLRESCLGLDRCPLVYVPEPHGRLIDADALVDKHFSKDYLAKTMTASKEEMGTVLVNIPLVINNAPTVIPANHGSGPDEV